MDRSVVFLDLKGGCAPCDKPLMLRPILFCPVLAWVAQELTVCGAQRFFIVCDEAWQDEVREVICRYNAPLRSRPTRSLSPHICHKSGGRFLIFFWNMLSNRLI